MQKIIAIACLTVIVSLHGAERMEAVYDVGFGIFGKVGEAHALLERTSKRYRIVMSMRTTGIAKRLSGNRREEHRSEGYLSGRRLVALRYDVVRRHGNRKVVKSYRFDHAHHRIRKVYEKFKNGKRYAHEETVLPFYATDDLLTLYFNLDAYIDKHRPGTYRFKAAGAERQKGEVTVVVPTEEEKRQYVEELGSGAAWYATVIIQQKIFASNEGRLKLAVGRDGITRKALLKDVVLFGDITATRVK